MSNVSRRSVMKTLALAGAATFASSAGCFSTVAADELPTADQIEAMTVKGDIRQSVSKWCFGKYPMEEFCKICKKIGLVGIDLVNPNEWDVLLKNNMIVTMGNVPGASIPTGFNHVQNHDKLIETYTKHIPLAAEKKVPNLICFSGNRAGIGDEEGLENCVVGLQKILPLAEEHGVTLVMELLNSKEHKDYQCDKTEWGAALAGKLGSERFKLLYDAYHMQRMEGDIINTIRKFKDVIGHYHTAGNPGRKDLDDEQEINYAPVIKAIKATGFKGFVAHEFLPKKDIDSLRDAIKICDV